MPVLTDPKREQFAQLIARGMTVIDAYTRAGYKRNTGNATAFRKRPDIVRRIEELQLESASHNEAELSAYLKDSGLTPTYIIRQLFETATEAKAAGKFDVAAKCFKDVGGELFGMFVERKHLSVEKQSVHTETTTTISLEGLNRALEGLADPSPKVIEGIRDAEFIDVQAVSLPPATVTSKRD